MDEITRPGLKIQSCPWCGTIPFIQFFRDDARAMSLVCLNDVCPVMPKGGFCSPNLTVLIETWNRRYYDLKDIPAK